MAEKTSAPDVKSNSRELLSISGDGSSRAVVESLMSRNPQREMPKTFIFARSPLLDELQSFLPEIQKANEQLLGKPSEELDAFDIENTDDDDNVVEMNVVLGEMDSDGEASNDDPSNGDSDDGPSFAPVTEENMKIPSEATGGQRGRRNLITEVGESNEDSEGDRSDGELTVASSSSAER